MGKRSLGDPEGAEDVRLQLIAKLLLRELFDQPELPVARVVDHDVQAAEMLLRLVDRGEARRTVLHVEREGEDAISVFGNEIPQGTRIARGGSHFVATVEGCDCPFTSEAARCAGNEPHLVRHVEFLDSKGGKATGSNTRQPVFRRMSRSCAGAS